LRSLTDRQERIVTKRRWTAWTADERRGGMFGGLDGGVTMDDGEDDRGDDDGMDDGTDDDAADPTDEELVDAWRNGDSEAGAALVRRHFRSVDRFFRNKVDEHQLADLVQHTFLECLKHPHRYERRKGATFRTYLIGIAHMLLLKHYREDARSRMHEPLEDLSIVDLGQTPSQILTSADEQRRLLEAVRRIPLKFQVVIELRFWEGLKQREIAEALGLPMGTVSFRIRRGLQLLRKILKEG
jgi:RNA polymerase sigma-70 factor, ECF subfamily